ncbi:efflux transporter outer membrane subunit [Suttonella sp. R2A3]|uniref:efflux transporter outer membrane subunit n=1 Tax=Suttonella sp. R2A3 TaxID=2908648 RepID=UPI001F466C1B|nr:efflux transporter outer membrane subunit [Suttonella sp. R2A3]UJF23742.1 efflux transporter outer membrane subunit [Suttonella sp. R2A3]
MKTKPLIIRSRWASLPLAVFLGACSFVPQYEQPQVPLAQQWIDVALDEQAADDQEISELGWRDYFRDPRLQRFIATALEHNHDLRKAALNTQIAQAQYGITHADVLPSLGAQGDYTRSRTARDFSPVRQATISEQYQVGLGMSAFELDFFGRVQALSDVALNKYLATHEARDAAQLSLIAAVAKTYYQARIAQASMALSEKVMQSRAESYRLAKLQFDAGLISAIALHGVESQIEGAKADYAAQKRNLRQAMNGLSMLVGYPVSALELPEAAGLDEQFAEMAIASNVSSAVLANRPDIREVEYQLKAANANIGAAKAAFFPSIKLTGNLGYGSTELNHLFDGGNLLWSFAPSISLPIFDGGRRDANLKISELQQQVLIEDYQQTVQQAFTDVADALVARETLADQYAAQQRGSKAVSERMRLENLRFENGVSSALDMLDAQRESYASRQGLLVTKQQILNNQVDLYTALGGGLKETASAPVEASSTPGAMDGLLK